MKPGSSESPPARWLVLDEVDSTQDVAAQALLNQEPVDVVFAHHQVRGRGRWGRTWDSHRHRSLTISLILRSCSQHPAPYLIGMACATSVAQCCGCKLRWPNDLVMNGSKVGGILTEIVADGLGGSAPVVGIGVNLDYAPEGLAATSLSEEGVYREAMPLAMSIVSQLPSPFPTSWAGIRSAWMQLDETPGKVFVTSDGERGIARGISSAGSLILDLNGRTREVLVADALPLKPVIQSPHTVL